MLPVGIISNGMYVISDGYMSACNKKLTGLPTWLLCSNSTVNVTPIITITTPNTATARTIENSNCLRVHFLLVPLGLSSIVISTSDASSSSSSSVASRGIPSLKDMLKKAS